MIRRRRRAREIPFSFDSFLDIVANVVGIIIRLILVVWVGARSYSSLQTSSPSTHSGSSSIEFPEPADPLAQDLVRHRSELAQAQERLLAQLRGLEQLQDNNKQLNGRLTALLARRQELEKGRATLEAANATSSTLAQTVALSSAELRQRSQKLAEEIRLLEQMPPPKQTLRYRTPISRPVQSEELLFECKGNHVTFIDIASLLTDVRQRLEEKGKLLHTSWQVQDLAGPVGAFRLRYTIERERDLLDAIGGEAAPGANGNFRYGLSEWQIEPIASPRGESPDAALAGNSEFRQIVDGLDPQQTAITMWVYPDSFSLFRRLRDYLYERDFVVAGRPLPEGIPIASSRRGSISRGQ
jgi:hypothetical protein